MDKILNYLKQPSTYKGILAILGVVGVTIKPDLWQEITATCVGIVGIIEVVRDEDK